MSQESKISFNINYLKESAANLAQIHAASKSSKHIRPVKPILEDSKKVLIDAYRILSGLAKKNQDLSPAAEWLIDNFYIVQEQVVQVGVDFPREFQRNLPPLSGGEHEGLPRVYELVMNFLTHTDNLVDEDVLINYVQHYQQFETLKLGEIWAIPIMIRLILIQKLSEKASRILQRKRIWRDVHELTTNIDEKDIREPGMLINKLSEWLKKYKSSGEKVLVLIELYNQLQQTGFLQDEQKRWFIYRFKQHDVTIDEAMRSEAQRQSRLQVSIQNAVITLRESTETDWADFVEECSIVDQILRLDPYGTYSQMDFETRDRYRRTVERISRHSNHSETDVAEKVLILAEDQGRINEESDDDSDPLFNSSVVKKHIGYFLVGNGYRELISALGYRMPIRERLQKKLENNPFLYILSIIVHTVLLMVVLWYVTDAFSESIFIATSVLVISLFPALDLSVAAMNRFFVFLLPPRKLNKMDFEDRIPDQSRTMIVVPTLFSSPDDVRDQLSRLEIRSLANPHPGLQFALLSDFNDSPNESEPGDREILDTAKRIVAEMNEKYSSVYGDKFFVLHRDRLWNESEEAWMGWERKRGKLEEFNMLLNDPDTKTSFSLIAGNFIDSIRSEEVKYIITLDSDTKLPPDSAINLIRTISHPLNQAYFNPDEKRITSGYAIIQPRISIPPSSARQTWFSRIFSGNVGLDPYSTAVSDIYQDLAGEAVFTGKGIYNVRAFHEVLSDRFPENRILSHDLIESTYLRTGLASDIELYDDYPQTYASFSKRAHRWTRGDWQIASWLFKQVPSRGGVERNRMNILSKWKIFDNLRRSLNPFFLTLFFIAGWFFLPGSAWLWTLFAFGILAFPIYVSLSTDIINRPARVRWMLYWEKVRANLKINTVQALFTVVILPHQAIVQLDAIFRTLYRLNFSRKNLLEWVSASQTESSSPNSLGAYLKMMIVPTILGISILFGAVIINPGYLWTIAPFFVIWGGSPFYVWYISQPIRDSATKYDLSDELKLREYARRTWFYFERMVTEAHSWLPPDNFQVDPPLPPTDRTSPTNIGLALVANLVAYNRGYVTYSEFLDRTENTLLSLEKMERYKGHFFNWYQTKLGEVLNPRYISTVDSGNLAAGLIVIKEGVKAAAKEQVLNENFWEGLKDTVRTVKNIFSLLEKECPGVEPCFLEVKENAKSILDKIDTSEKTGLDLLKEIKENAARLSAVDLMPLGSHFDDQYMQDLLYWLESPLKQLEKSIAEWKCLTVDPTMDLTEYSPEMLNELMQERVGNSQCVLLLNKWRVQTENIASISERLIDDMDFTFLYLKKRGLFSIGFNVEKAQLDKSTYDLLASEARIASYIAIAKGDIPVEHWFRLSRRLTSLSSNEILLSWGGTMFEYLMPLLFMKSIDETLMDQTYNNVVRWQQEYGKKQGKPWGFSESAYYNLNIDMHYQYRAFGAPGLGLKRGLAEEYVVAPYASLLSLAVDPVSSIENLKRIEKKGGSGLYGFYDAIDFTPSRMNSGESHKVVKSYMVHHHGMGLIALENLLNDNSIQHYFHSDLRIQGCELILEERVPRGVPIKEPHPIEVELEPGEQDAIQYIVEHAGLEDLDISPPRLRILSNGKYSTMVTHAGTGSSQFHNIAMNGWEPDPTIDPLGFYVYIKDTNSGKFWSAGHQPVKRKPDRYDSWFHNGKIVNSRVDEWIETTTEVCVSPDYPLELRKITLTNYSDMERHLEVTSYAEVVLNGRKDHNSHPAFSKLFIQTDYLAEHHALVAKRRPRSDKEAPMWMVHTFAGDDSENLTNPLQYETERSKFIGRGRTLSHPKAMDSSSRLECSLGNVSDPIMSLRKNISIGPGEKVVLSFGTGFASSEQEAIQMADMYDNILAVFRAFDLAEVYSSVELNHIGIKSKDAHYFQELASYVIYSNPRYRAESALLRENRKKQHDLWAYGISGDLPLVIFKINQTDQIKNLKMMLKAHAYWRLKGLETELLILNDHAPSYADAVQEAIIQLIESSSERGLMNKYGGIFLHRTDKMPPEDLTLVYSVAHAQFDHELPAKEELVRHATDTKSWLLNDDEPDIRPAVVEYRDDSESQRSVEDLQFYNGFGGFSSDGKEYRIQLNIDQETNRHIFPPAPWVNILSNPDFGSLISERGAGYTWSENSRENKITTWSNDPVMDPHSEAFYIRNNDRRTFWSPSPGPVPGNGSYEVVHGFGYTTFLHTSEELNQELTHFVPLENSVKVSRLVVENLDNKPISLSIFRYLDRVLGVNRNSSSRYVTSNYVPEMNTLISKNYYNNEFSGRVAYSGVFIPESESEIFYTTDRESFIGRNRSLENPDALFRYQNLDNSDRMGSDPCAALQINLDLEKGERRTIYFLDGEAKTEEEVKNTLLKYGDPENAESQLQAVKKFWADKVDKVQVTTPDQSIDLMVNGWLTYQNLSSRMWGRTAYYQAGGAFGFRDQLQDSMALLYVDPALTRKQILLHASKQFEEGDVLHWWHPPTGRGIRSKITDDRLWLPYVTENYVRVTGDRDILTEEINYITSRALEDHEHEVYLTPQVTGKTGSLYDHCCRAIDISLQFGQHGLPLMGAGDWNDGMNRVGEEGRGESVWLGFFIYSTLRRFIPICKKMGDIDRAERYKQTASELKKRLNDAGWDGEWYLRAFYDDGTPLGSVQNEECKIDAISQAWAVISGVATGERAQQSLLSAETHLISESDGIIRLLKPPFDKTDKNPGYIKGYIPGVRENGGQYTHGALWLIKAMAELGMGEKAVSYLNMVNPINHSSSKERSLQYKVEPYVVAADVYGEPPLTGMGGWTWYTGSGGWMYRVMLESVLGFSVEGKYILLNPAISKTWKSYTIRYKPDEIGTEYIINIHNQDRVESGRLAGLMDQKELSENGKVTRIEVINDGKVHRIELQISKEKEAKV
jgi:cyclic beta-1,2-glucan synthetase